MVSVGKEQHEQHQPQRPQRPRPPLHGQAPLKATNAVAAMRRGQILAAEKPPSVKRATGPTSKRGRVPLTGTGGGPSHSSTPPDSTKLSRGAAVLQMRCYINPGAWDDFKGRQSHHPSLGTLPAVLFPGFLHINKLTPTRALGAEDAIPAPIPMPWRVPQR